MTEELIDWLIDWLMTLLIGTHSYVDWLFYSLTDWLADWRTDWLTAGLNEFRFDEGKKSWLRPNYHRERIEKLTSRALGLCESEWFDEGLTLETSPFEFFAVVKPNLRFHSTPTQHHSFSRINYFINCLIRNNCTILALCSRLFCPFIFALGEVTLNIGMKK